MSSPHLFSPYDAPMWESIAQRRMKLQKCARCGAFRYPPGPSCPDCLCIEAAWEPISGLGELLSWTVFHRQYLPAFPPPYVVAAVKLQEGPILVSNIAAAERAGLAVGAAVRLIYVEHPEGYRVHHVERLGSVAELPGNAEDGRTVRPDG